MKVSLVILLWNSAEYMENCLKSVKKLDTKGVDLEVLVVDNGSTDNGAKIIKTQYPEFSLILNDTNAGYAEGNNIGIRKAQSTDADFIWIVNPDVVLHENSLQKLLEAAAKYRTAGIFGSKIYFAPGFEFHKDRYKKEDIGKVIWYAGGQMDWKNMEGMHRGVDEVDHGQFDNDGETDFVTGASMFIRRHVVDYVGALDWRYYLYYEENDFCQRAKKFGWKLMYIPDSIAWHANAQSAGVGSILQDYFIVRNRMLFGLRYAPVYVKLLLIKQSLWIYRNGREWQKKGIRDYYFGNFGRGSFPEKK